MTTKTKPLTPGLDLESVQISVGANGYLVETPEHGIQSLSVFNSFADLVEYLFRNLEKPTTSVEH